MTCWDLCPFYWSSLIVKLFSPDTVIGAFFETCVSTRMRPET